MGRDTRAGARQEVWELLTTGGVPVVGGIAHAYRCDPGPGHTGYPTFLIVASGHMTANAYGILVRVAATSDVNTEAAQDAVDELSLAVDLLLTPTLGPGTWEDEYDPDLDAWVSSAVFDVPREDDLLRLQPPGGLV